MQGECRDEGESGRSLAKPVPRRVPTLALAPPTTVRAQHRSSSSTRPQSRHGRCCASTVPAPGAGGHPLLFVRHRGLGSRVGTRRPQRDIIRTNSAGGKHTWNILDVPGSTPVPFPAPTFEVHQAIAVEIHVLEDLINLPIVELLPQELAHGLPQLCHADLPVPIGVKLRTRFRCHQLPRHTGSPLICHHHPRTSRKASRSSLIPIISAVSASILGPISSTKSSKSTLPPAAAGEGCQPGMRQGLMETRCPTTY